MRFMASPAARRAGPPGRGLQICRAFRAGLDERPTAWPAGTSDPVCCRAGREALNGRAALRCPDLAEIARLQSPRRAAPRRATRRFGGHGRGAATLAAGVRWRYRGRLRCGRRLLWRRTATAGLRRLRTALRLQRRIRAPGPITRTAGWASRPGPALHDHVLHGRELFTAHNLPRCARAQAAAHACQCPAGRKQRSRTNRRRALWRRGVPVRLRTQADDWASSAPRADAALPPALRQAASQAPRVDCHGSHRRRPQAGAELICSFISAAPWPPCRLASRRRPRRSAAAEVLQELEFRTFAAALPLQTASTRCLDNAIHRNLRETYLAGARA